MRKAPASRRGQSLIEVIVASAIIMTSVSAALTLVSSSINAEKNSEAQITAGNLAREGIEAVRSIRDSNWLAGLPFDTGLTGTVARDYTGVPVFDPNANSWSFDFYPDDIADLLSRVYRYTTGSGNAVVGLMIQGEPRGVGVSPTGVVPTGAIVSPYRRYLEMDPMCENGSSYTIAVHLTSDCGAARKIGLRVISTVQWQVAGAVRTLSVEERLFDWR